MTATTVAIVAAIGLYLVVLLVLGWVGHRRLRHSLDDYFLAGRSLGPVVLVLTLGATTHSMFATVGATGSFYDSGVIFLWGAGTWVLIQPLTYWSFGSRIWQLGRARGHITPADLFRDRYDSPIMAGITAATMFVFVAPYIMAQTIGAGLVLEQVTDGAIPFALGAALILVVMTLYDLLGGMRTVAWTDTVQGTLMYVAMWAAALYVVYVTLDGIGPLMREVARTAPELLSIDQAQWPSYLGLIVLFGLGALFQPHVWSRMLMGRDPKVMSTVSGTIGIYMMTLFLPGLLLGLAGYVLLADSGGDAVLPGLLNGYLPPWLAALLAAGLLAAAMSTVDSIVRAADTIVVKDLLKTHLMKQADDRQLIRAGKWAFLLLVLLSYIGALNGSAGIIALTALAWSGPLQLLPALIGAVYWPRATKQGAITGTVAGLLTLALTTWVWPDPFGWHAILWSFLVNGPFFVAVSLVTPPTQKATLARIFDPLEQAGLPCVGRRPEPVPTRVDAPA
jgi:SSS family solute:Na+ symporter